MNQKYKFNKKDLIITYFEKKPFEAHLGIIHNPSNKSLPESSVHAWVTFYGEVKLGQFTKSHYEISLLYYDDFESGSLSKWSQIGSPVILGSAAWEGGYGVKSTGDARDYIYKNWIGQPQKIEIDFAFKKNSNDGYGGAAWGGGNYRIIGINTVTFNRFVVRDDTYHTLGAWDYAWHAAAIKIAGNSTKYYLDGAEKYTTSGSTSVNQINFYSAGPTGNFYFDYIRIYKYESPEPVWA